MGMFKSIALAAGISAVAALGAQAATVSINASPDINSLKSTSTSLPGGGSWAPTPNEAHSTTGTVGGIAKSPYGDTTTPYWFVESVDTTSAGGFPVNSPAILLLKSVRTSLSLLWGSPDVYNKLVLKLAGAEVYSISGEELGGTAYVRPSGSVATTEGPTSFLTIAGVKFDSVEFYSSNTWEGKTVTKNAFEFGNVAAVPVPAAGLMLIAGLGGLAAVRRRKA